MRRQACRTRGLDIGAPHHHPRARAAREDDEAADAEQRRGRLPCERGAAGAGAQIEFGDREREQRIGEGEEEDGFGVHACSNTPHRDCPR